MADEKLPHWDLGNVYPGLASAELAADAAALAENLARIDRHHTDSLAPLTASASAKTLARELGVAVDLFNRAWELSTTLEAYVDSFVATDSYDAEATKKQSELEITQVGLKNAWTRFQRWTGRVAPALPAALEQPGSARQHAFALKEAAAQSAFLMSDPEETLAAELSLAGANAWSKLQGTITSQITVDWELDGKHQKLPIAALVNLRSHPDERVRKAAYEAEIGEWKKVRAPLAACMNGVKGAAVTLNRRRGRVDGLHAPIDLARIDRPTLEALLGAMKGSLPLFTRYFKAKAARMGKERLAWWDLFAPSGGRVEDADSARASHGAYGWSEARAFILENFAGFSASLRDFAEHAFASGWIDAEPRDGKRGGGFCVAVPKVKESRILCNFDGTLEQVSTVAHELGHGFHNHCAYAAGKTELQQATPLTMAETASILCETIVTNAVLARARDPQEELAVLENELTSASQVIVDIYSRYLFEKEVMERREHAELSAADLCDIMERAQGAAYGDGLDGRFRHGYMWTWKPHYYFHSLDFYNFPYAFGLLFGTGLYAIYQKRGAPFIPDYERLLASTGEDGAAELAARFGIDIRSRSFWDDSIAVIGRRVDRYCAL